MDKNNPGLDMKHGFLHHIRRNQYKRDEYDKEAKTKVTNPGTRKQDPAKHPDRRVYSVKNDEADSRVRIDTRTSSPGMGRGRLLYMLEYTDNAGCVHKVEVHEFDKPNRLAKNLAAAAKIPRELVGTLEWKIQEDIAKRNA